jgi:hypothetical protein
MYNDFLYNNGSSFFFGEKELNLLKKGKHGKGNIELYFTDRNT